MPLELDSLRDANQAVGENSTRMLRFGEMERNGVLSDVIHNFGVTNEVAWKFAARWSDNCIGPRVTDGATRRQLVRLTAQWRAQRAEAARLGRAIEAKLTRLGFD